MGYYHAARKREPPLQALFVFVVDSWQSPDPKGRPGRARLCQADRAADTAWLSAAFGLHYPRDQLFERALIEAAVSDDIRGLGRLVFNVHAG
jgi:hypothetical protein